jgi:hypothetical protein
MGIMVKSKKSLDYFLLFLNEYFGFLFGALGEPAPKPVPWYLVKNPPKWA